MLELYKIQLYCQFYWHYISLPFFIFWKKRLKNLKILVFFILFVDNGLFVSHEKSLEKSTSYLFCSYNVFSFLFNQFSLVIKYRKTEIFHFSRVHRVFNPLFGSLHSRRFYSLYQRYMVLSWVHL